MSNNKQSTKTKNGKMDETPLVKKSNQPDLPAIFSRTPEKALQEMETLVITMNRKCTDHKFIAEIKGKSYPRLEWWTTIGSILGLHPVTVRSRRLERNTAIVYESRVEVRYRDRTVAAGEALCSSEESTWANADEYAIKSMAITRATGKAYRIPLSHLAVMAGLNPTNAEEVPVEDNRRKQDPATVKQLDYLLFLSQEKYGKEDGFHRIESSAQKRFGHKNGQELFKHEASAMIELLNSGRDLPPVED